MTTNFLGHFLIQQGVISEDQLADAVRYQRETNKRLGEVAIERGALTALQVDEICAKQRGDARMFGAIAVNDLHLSRKRLDELLFIQKIHYIYLGEALLLRGHITSPQYAALMRDFYDLENDRKLDLKYIQEFFAEHKALSSLVEAFIRAYSRYAGETIKIGAVAARYDSSEYESAREISGVLSGGRDFCGMALFSGPMGERLDSLEPYEGTDVDADEHETGIFDVVVRYFSSILRERGLFLEQVSHRPAPVSPSIADGVALIRLDAPSGVCGVCLSCSENVD